MIHSGFCIAAPGRCSEGCQHDKEEDHSHPLVSPHRAAGTLAGKMGQDGYCRWNTSLSQQEGRKTERE